MFTILIRIIVGIMLLIYFYNTAVTFFSWKKIKSTPNDCAQTTRIGIMIPCHNEEAVIYETLDAISHSYYDNALFVVYVVADNCTDNTVDIAIKYRLHSNMDIRIIQVAGGSKPKAINLAVAHLKKNNEWEDDLIMVLDADNIVSRTLLSCFNKHYISGEVIMQCRIASKNDSSFVAKGFTSSFNTMGSGFQLARNNIGINASLSGTGFCVDRLVWDTVKFDNCTTLTEDLEFATLCTIAGYYIKFIHDDCVYNENLDEFIPSLVQRTRWCRGHVQVAVKLSGEVVRKFVRKPSLQLFDTFVTLNTPSRAMLYVTCTILTGFEIVSNPSFRYIRPIGILIFIYNVIFILRCNMYKIKYIIPHIFFSFCMYFIIIYGLCTYKKSKWAKTKHTGSK